MIKQMPDDGLGDWTAQEIDGVQVQWRRREYRASEALHGTDFVIDISLDGAPPVTQPDFNENVDASQELALRVSFLRN